MKTERIIYGNANVRLPFLKGQLFDMIYIDPPFFSDRLWASINENYNQKKAFNDRYTDIKKYMDEHGPIIDTLPYFLKEDGTFYLHCDFHGYQSLKTRCDDAFKKCGGIYVGEIYWRTRSNNNRGGKKYANVVQNILVYAKTKNYKFFPQKNGTSSEFPYIERETGYRYALSNLVHYGDGQGPTSLYFDIEHKNLWTIPATTKKRVFKWSQEHLDKEIKKNHRAIEFKKNMPYYKRYEIDYKGTDLSNLWLDIPGLKQGSTESTYPTKKPIELLERLILTSTKEGDTILDCYCGGGTTAEAAKKQGRGFVCIDKSIDAVAQTAKAIGKSPDATSIEFYPLKTSDILSMDDMEVQKWVCRLLGAWCGRDGRDKGTDGFLISDNLMTKSGYPIQVKQKNIGEDDVDHYKARWESEGHNQGVLVGGVHITSTARLRAEFYKKKGFTFFLYTIQDIVEGKAIDDGICGRYNMNKLMYEDYRDKRHTNTMDGLR